MKIAHDQVLKNQNTRFYGLEAFWIDLRVQLLFRFVETLVRLVNHLHRALYSLLRLELVVVHQKGHQTLKLAMQLWAFCQR